MQVNQHAVYVVVLAAVFAVVKPSVGSLVVWVNDQTVIDNDPAGFDRDPTINRISINTSQAPWPTGLAFRVRGTIEQRSFSSMLGDGYLLRAFPLDIGDISGSGSAGVFSMSGQFSDVGLSPFSGWYAWTSASGDFDDWIDSGVPYINLVQFTSNAGVRAAGSDPEAYIPLPELKASAEERFPRIPFQVSSEKDGNSTVDGARIILNWSAGPWDVIRFPLEVSTSPIPEPTLIVLLLYGTASIGMNRRQRRRH